MINGPLMVRKMAMVRLGPGGDLLQPLPAIRSRDSIAAPAEAQRQYRARGKAQRNSEQISLLHRSSFPAAMELRPNQGAASHVDWSAGQFVALIFGRSPRAQPRCNALNHGADLLPLVLPVAVHASTIAGDGRDEQETGDS